MTESIKDGAIEIQGTVDFIEKYPRYTAAYSYVPGKKGFMVSKHAIDSTIAPGDAITMYLRPENIQLRDLESGEKLIAFRPVTNNSASALVTVKENIATVAFGKSRIQMITNAQVREPGSTVINIDPRCITVGKEAVSKSPKTVVVGKVKDADVLGANTIVYAEVEGIDGFCAIVPGTVNYNINDKVKFVVDPAGITVGVKPSVGEVIASKVAEAPAYVFVEEKPAPKASAKAETAATKNETAEEKPAKKTAAKKPAAKTAAAKPAAKKAPAKKPAK